MLPPDFYGCGSCLSRLKLGDSGSLSNSGNRSCLWLLHTEHTGARIKIECDNIQLPSCRVRPHHDDHIAGIHALYLKGSDTSGTIPNLDNALVITQNWDFTRSHVYCGNETGRHVEHVSTCGRMAVPYIHLDRDRKSVV